MPVPSPADRVSTITQIGCTLTRYRLVKPALFVLDAGQPLIPLVAQLIYVAQPALSLFWPYEKLSRLGELLEDSQGRQQLRTYLEAE